MTGKSSEHDPKGYRNRTYGKGGGYGQDGPSLSDEGGIPEAPPRRAPREEGGGGHLGEFEAEHWHGRSEREPGEEGAGGHERFGEDGFDSDRLDAAERDRGRTARARDEAGIVDDVLSRLGEDEDLDATAIDVSVSDATVTLSGSVDSEEAKRRAEDLARSVEGVADVLNDLGVQSDWLGPIPGTTPVRH
jgi:hypothetical protein